MVWMWPARPVVLIPVGLTRMRQIRCCKNTVDFVFLNVGGLTYTPRLLTCYLYKSMGVFYVILISLDKVAVISAPVPLGMLKTILMKAPNAWSSDESGLLPRTSHPPAGDPRLEMDAHTLPGRRGGCSTCAGSTCVSYGEAMAKEVIGILHFCTCCAESHTSREAFHNLFKIALWRDTCH